MIESSKMTKDDVFQNVIGVGFVIGVGLSDNDDEF